MAGAFQEGSSDDVADQRKGKRPTGAARGDDSVWRGPRPGRTDPSKGSASQLPKGWRGRLAPGLGAGQVTGGWV